MEQTIQRIKEIAIEKFSLGHDSIHGLEHWEKVHENATLLALQPGVDIFVVRLFAYLHDCLRFDDYMDPEHGYRSAELVLKLREQGLLNELTEKQVMELHYACYHHNGGDISDNPTIGACYDADRLELIRCGIVPLPELMSTPLGKRIAVKMQQTAEYR